MKSNPRDWRIDQLKTVAHAMGMSVSHSGTSHVIFRHASAGRLTVPAHRPIKPVYIRLFLDLVERVGGTHEN